MVFRTLARLAGPRLQKAQLEDLAQTVFLRLFRALPNFRGDAQITTYLYRIAVNVAQDEWKRCRREDAKQTSLSDEDSNWEGRLEDPAPDALAQLEQSEFVTLVEDRLQALSHTERSVLVLFHQEDRTYEQIAETLALPLNTVRTHLHRARKKLREALATPAQDSLSRKLTRALETPRLFTIPDNFAARTAAAAAALPAPASGKPRTSFTDRAIRGAFAVLALAMLFLAAWTRTAPNAQQLVFLSTEIALALEFVGLTTWLSLRPRSTR